MTDPLMARMASQMRDQQIATLNTAMAAAVAAGDVAEVQKLSDQKGTLMAQTAAPAPKFSATDVRSAIAKLAPDAVKDLTIRQKLGEVANGIANGTVDISDFDNADELARAMLKSAGRDLAAEEAAAAAAKKAEEEAAAKKKKDEEAAAAGDGDGDEDEDEDEDEDDEEEEDAAAAATERRRRKPARMSREEPQLGSGRPAAATKSLDKITKASELPKESRAQWERMTRNGGMSAVKKLADQGDEAAKSQIAKAETNYIAAEVKRLKSLRVSKR